ncbi:MAG: transketolase, partial [Muribaculaceae bacterium]|nr:transketolase [Muribaculaceae bacterium]
PGDSAETSVAWKMALENQSTPTALILSRQNITDLPAASGNRYQEALGEEKGGYIVMQNANPEVILVANGSEVSLLCEVAAQLEAGQIPCRVVSVPSIGLFMEQPVEYRNSVITPGAKVFGLTAGLPSTLRGLVGAGGEVFGLDHFGASAPYKVLDEKFGFTVQNITETVLKFIGK